MSEFFGTLGLTVAATAFLAGVVALAQLRTSSRIARTEPVASIGAFLVYAPLAYLLSWAMHSWVHAGSFWAFLGFLAPVVGFHVGLKLRFRGRTDDNMEPRDRLALAILSYGEKLAEEHRDHALLEHRNNTSRTLHLLGAHDRRIALGACALRSAQREGEVLVEASILLDDLGWASYQLGRVDEARRYVNSGIELLTGRRDQPSRSLLVKAYRHLAAFSSKADLDLALQELDDAKKIAEGLTASRKRFETAGLDAGRAYLVVESLDAQFDPQAVFTDGNSREHQLLMEAEESAIRSRDCYAELGDIERAAKSAALLLRIYRHLGRKRELEAATAALEELERQAIRDVGQLSGMRHG